MAFAGWEEELAVFNAALYGGGCSVLYVHGPGGIGTSALLRRFAHEAAVAGRPMSMVDGRMLEPSPAGAAAVSRKLAGDGFDPVASDRQLFAAERIRSTACVRVRARSSSTRALSVTFLHGTPTQELAAERLGVPSTSYRRHLTAGIERVCADLWHRELYGTDAPAYRST
ncbi:hypothetical protein [Nonomuraea africana]|uniref:ATP-binding protein n=1 Tax=Nonomuraea africana TaxID=46171 RepID=A0ABR9KEB4_9ACTN|nr:hypothetical protein [Nonomuraea africana]MBE1560376.1 hypothetical protein [Nonomuraea africana]